MNKIIRSQKDFYEKVYGQKNYISIEMPDLKIVNSEKVQGKKIAVMGAGTGRDIRFLTKSNEIWGLDNTEQAIRVLKKNNIQAMLADMNKPLKLKNNYFDIVIAKDILEHLDYPQQLASEIFRILKKSGYAVINVPNHFFLPMRLRVLFGKNLIWNTIDHNHTQYFDEWNYMHKTFFTWNGFRKFLKINNLEIIKKYWDFGTLNHYSQPEIYFAILEQRNDNFSKYLLLPTLRFFWIIFNIIFPRQLRSLIVSTSPSLMCASFYVWCKPIK